MTELQQAQAYLRQCSCYKCDRNAELSRQFNRNRYNQEVEAIHRAYTSNPNCTETSQREYTLPLTCKNRCCWPCPLTPSADDVCGSLSVEQLKRQDTLVSDKNKTIGELHSLKDSQIYQTWIMCIQHSPSHDEGLFQLIFLVQFATTCAKVCHFPSNCQNFEKQTKTKRHSCHGKRKLHVQAQYTTLLQVRNHYSKSHLP